jgi:hypothetical protein
MLCHVNTIHIKSKKKEEVKRRRRGEERREKSLVYWRAFTLARRSLTNIVCKETLCCVEGGKTGGYALRIIVREQLIE